MASGKKYNIYIREANLRKWESLDSYSGWVNEQLEREQTPVKIIPVEEGKLEVKEWWED